MSKLPFDRIEELVEESVFHPSPCKRHRERVLRDAAQATVRQKLSRRMIVAVSASALLLGMGIILVRMTTTSGDAVPGAAAPASAATVEARTAPSSTPPAAAGSMGEDLYRGTDSSDAQPATSGGL
jgi:hypothetical protein